MRCAGWRNSFPRVLPHPFRQRNCTRSGFWLGASIPKFTPAARFADWQSGAEETFQAARREEMLISLLLGVAPGPQPAALAADLARTLAEVRSDLDECRRLLGQ
jgi:hypothetical protein